MLVYNYRRHITSRPPQRRLVINCFFNFLFIYFQLFYSSFLFRISFFLWYFQHSSNDLFHFLFILLFKATRHFSCKVAHTNVLCKCVVLYLCVLSYLFCYSIKYAWCVHFFTLFISVHCILLLILEQTIHDMVIIIIL